MDVCACQGIHPYAYVGNDPLDYIDPTGTNPLLGAVEGAEIGSLLGPAGAVAGGVLGVGVGVGVGWLGNQLIDQINKNGSESKPKNCPAGTLPMDKAKRKFGIDHEGVEAIKDGSLADPDTWTGVAPNGDIWIGTTDGEGRQEGNIGDYGYGPDQ